MRWECSECGAWIERPRRPARCRSCRSDHAEFVACAPDAGDAAQVAESLYESWARRRTHPRQHWRSRAA